MTLRKRGHGYKVIEDSLPGMGANGPMPDGSILTLAPMPCQIQGPLNQNHALEIRR